MSIDHSTSNNKTILFTFLSLQRRILSTLVILTVFVQKYALSQEVIPDTLVDLEIREFRNTSSDSTKIRFLERGAQFSILEVESKLKGLKIKPELEYRKDSSDDSSGIQRYVITSQSQSIEISVANHMRKSYELNIDSPSWIVLVVKSKLITTPRKLDSDSAKIKPLVVTSSLPQVMPDSGEKKPDASSLESQETNNAENSRLRLNIYGESINELASVSGSAALDLKVMRRFSLLGGYGYSYFRKPTLESYQTASGVVSSKISIPEVHSVTIGSKFYFIGYDNQTASLSVTFSYGINEDYLKYMAMLNFKVISLPKSVIGIMTGYSYHEASYEIPVFNFYGNAFKQEKVQKQGNVTLGIQFSFILF